MFLNRKIDHLVYAVPDLEVAMDWVEQAFGVRPLFGGYHLTQGTKNAVLHLGNKSYLEILAIDEGNKNIEAPRWMGVDELAEAQLTRWALQSDDLNADAAVVKKYQATMGHIQGGQRQTSNGDLLTWEMIMPLAQPLVELMPFMTDWQKSAVHPTDSLPEICRLINLEFRHPNPPLLNPYLEALHLDIDLIQDQKISLKAKIQTPRGIVEI